MPRISGHKHRKFKPPFFLGIATVMPIYEILRMRRKYLSHMSVARPSTDGDGLLPAGWHLLADWHFTASNFNCRTSAALRLSKRGRRQTFIRVLAKPKRYSVCVSEGVGDTEMDNLICPALLPVEMPVGLTHLDSDLCWCDPIVEVDDDGEHVLLHRQVTWN